MAVWTACAAARGSAGRAGRAAPSLTSSGRRLLGGLLRNEKVGARQERHCEGDEQQTHSFHSDFLVRLKTDLANLTRRSRKKQREALVLAPSARAAEEWAFGWS